MRKRNRLIRVLLLLLLCTGCSAFDNPTEQTAGNDSVHDAVYVFHGSKITTLQGGSEQGAISRDGTLLLPLSDLRLEIVRDLVSNQALWLQSRKIYVENSMLSAEELYADRNWEQIKNQYRLYDLKGNELQNLGERGIQTVCGDLVLYYDKTLEQRKTEQILYTDVDSLHWSAPYYVLQCEGWSRTLLLDQNLQTVWEGDGNVLLSGDRLRFTQDGKMGLFTLDGTEIIPCQYELLLSTGMQEDYIIAMQGQRIAVAAAQDGTILYQTDRTDSRYIDFADETVMIVRSRVQGETGEEKNIAQMFDYNGKAISKPYQYIWAEYDSAVYEQEQDYLFTARDEKERPALLNQKGQVLYQGLPNQSVEVVTTERIIVGNYQEKQAQLQDLAGNRLNEKDYDHMYVLYLLDGSYGIQKAPLVIGMYQFGNTQLQDLLDTEGNLLIEQAKSIQGLATDRFWVEKGFSQGLMDHTGTWLYEQSLFDSSADE